MKNVGCDQIGALIQIQETDSHICRINATLAVVNERVCELDVKLDNFSGSIKAKEDEIDTIKKKLGSHELEIQECDKRIERGQSHIKNITNNREYQAVQREVDDAKKRKSTLEDHQIELLESIEKLERETADLKNDYAQLEKFIISQKTEIYESSVSERKELEKLEKSRRKAAEIVTPPLLAKYESILKQIGSRAVAPVDRSICGGCHMSIPAQMFIELQRCKEFMYCPRCRRIIYWAGCFKDDNE